MLYSRGTSCDPITSPWTGELPPRQGRAGALLRVMGAAGARDRAAATSRGAGTRPGNRTQRGAGLVRTPAYIDIGGPAAIRLDGPSLVVERPEHAPERLPFARLGRMVVRGDVTMCGGV